MTLVKLELLTLELLKMTKDEIIKYLLKDKTIFEIKGNYYPRTGLNIDPKAKKLIWCLNLPDKYKALSLKLAYIEFTYDIKIPLWSNGNARYMLKTQTLAAEKAFRRMLKDEALDFNLLVSSLEAYYSTSSNVYKTSLAKLLESNTWVHIYESTDNIEKPDNTVWK